MYAQVVLSSASSFTDKIYDYAVPENLKIEIGHQVKIPFGKREAIGYVVGFSEKTEALQTKEIISLLSPAPFFSENQVKLSRWIAEYYRSFLISALRLIMPPGTKQKEKRC